MSGDAIIGLADALDALRAELSHAVDNAAGGRMQFRLDPIELTVEAAVTRDANGSIGWKILEFGASRSTESTQTLKLKLTPLWRDSSGALRSDFTVADQSAEQPHFGHR